MEDEVAPIPEWLREPWSKPEASPKRHWQDSPGRIAVFDIEQLKMVTSDRLEELCRYLIPGGRRKCGRWTAASIAGGKGESFSVNLKTGQFGDWAVDHRMQRGPIDLWMAARQVDFRSAVEGLADWLGMALHEEDGGTEAIQNQVHSQPAREPRQQCDDRRAPLFPKLEPSTKADLEAMVCTRGYHLGGLHEASRRKFLWAFNDEINGRAWLYTDCRRRCGLRRRLDDKRFVLKDGSEAKSASCYGSTMSEPLGYLEARRYPDFVVVEGGPDGLSVLSLAWSYAMEQRIAPIVMPCSTSSFNAESLSCLAGKNGRVFVDNDGPGYAAAIRWLEQLTLFGIDADAFTFERLFKACGKPVKDLCDVHRLSAESWRDNIRAVATMCDFGWEKEQKRNG